MTEEVTFRPYDMAVYLRDEGEIAAYIAEAAAEGDPASLATALGTIARARGMTQLAKATGLTREGLSKALGPKGNPTLATVMKVADVLGFQVALKPKTV